MVEVSKRARGLQPVETAPKDGRYFLFAGSNFDGGWAVVHWDDGLGWWYLDDGKNFEIPLRREGGLIGWRELPEADTKTETAMLREALEALVEVCTNSECGEVDWRLAIKDARAALTGSKSA